MLLRRLAFLAAFATASGVSVQASAGILQWLYGNIGREIAGGVVEKQEQGPARARTDDHPSDPRPDAQHEAFARYRFGDTTAILEQRILHMQVGADEVLDQGLDKIDVIAKARLDQTSATPRGLVQLDRSTRERLSQADRFLNERLPDVRAVASGIIDQADGALAAHLEHPDEAPARRWENTDVLAAQQRLGLENTVIRTVWIIAGVAFVVFLLRGLWSEYLRVEDKIGENAKRRANVNEPRSEQSDAGIAPEKSRLRLHVKGLLGRLARHLLVGLAVAAILASLPRLLPSSATRQMEQLTQHHKSAMETALRELDFARVTFHASQLEMLEPQDSAQHRAMSAKAALLRDLFTRSGALSSLGDVSQLLERLQALERIRSGRPDPDGQVVRAMIAWQQGRSRSDMRRAATVATRALWGNPGGFTLTPVARLIVETYLLSPCPPFEAECSPDGDDSEPVASMMAMVTATPAAPPGSAFEGVDLLFRAMARLRISSDAAFVDMVEGQAKAVAADASHDRASAIAQRNLAAGRVVDAWRAFDLSLRKAPALADNPLTLAVFRLNDVVLSHALWFVMQDQGTNPPPRLADLKQDTDLAIKLGMAPARVVWARRYPALLKGSIGAVVRMQEADRFVQMEEATLAFEAAYVSYVALPATAGAKKLQAQIDLASAGAGLGLYAERGDGVAGASNFQQRVPFGLVLGGAGAPLPDQVKAIGVSASERKSRAAKADIAIERSFQLLRAKWRSRNAWAM